MKVLIVGLGSIGQRHLRNLRHLESKIEIIAHRSVGRNLVISGDIQSFACEDLGKFYGIETFTDYQEALAQNPDAVFITCPTSLHIVMALQAAIHGCHLFIEKPISHTMDDVQELLKTVERNNLVAMVGYQLHFHQALKAIHGKLPNRVLSVHCEFGEYLPDAHPYEGYSQGYAARSDLGGGALLCLSHELDYCRWLFGMPKRLFAIGGKLSSLNIDVEDTSDILMECERGCKIFPVHVHLDFSQRPSSRKCSIITENGNLFWDYFSPPIERNPLFLDEVGHFLKCLAGTEVPEVSLLDAVDTLKIALAAKESMRTGKMVEL